MKSGTCHLAHGGLKGGRLREAAYPATGELRTVRAGVRGLGGPGRRTQARRLQL